MTEIRIAATLIFHNGKFLLVREHYGLWEHPGGYVREGETFEGAAVRETFEELGLIVKVSSLVNAHYSKDGKELIVKKIFLANIVGGKLKLSEDKEVNLFSPNELEGHFGKSVKQSIYDCVNHRYGLTYYPDGAA